MPGRDKAYGIPEKERADEDFTGHVLDDSTNLHYAGARYYSAAFGRWTSIDPLADAFPSRTPYNYAMNNPLRYSDPTGLASEDSTSGCPDCVNDKPIQLPEVVVTAEGPGNGNEGGGNLNFTGSGRFTHGTDESGNTFTFNSSTQAGRRAFRRRLMRRPSKGCGIVGNSEFSVTAQQVAMDGCMYAGQFSSLYGFTKGAILLGGTAATLGQGTFYALGARGLVSSFGYSSSGLTAAASGFDVYEGEYAKAAATAATIPVGYGRTRLVRYVDKSMGAIRGYGDVPYRVLGANSVVWSQGVGVGMKGVGSGID